MLEEDACQLYHYVGFASLPSLGDSMTYNSYSERKTIGFLNLTAENEESALWKLAQLNRFTKSPPFPPFVMVDSLSLEARYTNSDPPINNIWQP